MTHDDRNLGPARKALTYGLFPAVFVLALAGAHLAFGAGVATPVILLVVSTVTVAICALAERVHPEFPDWNRSRGDVGTDLTHGLVSMVALPQLLNLALPAALLSLVIALGWAGEGGGPWPGHWPVFAQLVPAMLLSQLGEYWAHRLMHEVPLLWRLHATHHSPTRLYWLNAARFHPLDTAASYTLGMSPLLVLGVGEEVLLLYSAWIAVHGLFQHSNIHVRLGPLNYVFSMAELHRWHHSLVLDEANANYGNNVLFWDLVFGTVFWPKDRDASERIGLSGLPAFPQDYVGQILSPFRWKRIEAAGVPASERAAEPAG